MKRIAIDAGHGIDTPGKRTPIFEDGTQMKENEFNRAVADYLDSKLHENGFHTVIVAPEWEDVPLKIRVQRANEAKADLYISIHANAYGAGWNDANGIETYIYNTIKEQTPTYCIAEKIHRSLVLETKLKDRGLKKNDFYVIRETQMPAILVECGFMTNLKEAVQLKSDGYRRQCAKAICRGICEFYQIKYQEEYHLTIEEAKKIVKEKYGFDENTMKYLEFYRYGESLLKKLAKEIEKESQNGSY